MQELVKIVVDAMGGDNAPQSTVKGTVDALNKSQEISVFLVGQEDVIKKELEQYKNAYQEQSERYNRLFGLFANNIDYFVAGSKGNR